MALYNSLPPVAPRPQQGSLRYAWDVTIQLQRTLQWEADEVPPISWTPIRSSQAGA